MSAAFVYQGEFPGQIPGILHTGVHALTAGRAVDMGSVARQKDTASTILRYLSLMDAKPRKPMRLRQAHSSRPAFVDDVLYVGQRRIGRMAGRLGRAHVGDDSAATGGKGKEGQHALLVPVQAQLVER